jgi:hypothetical protein
MMFAFGLLLAGWIAFYSWQLGGPDWLFVVVMPVCLGFGAVDMVASLASVTPQHYCAE